ncbi:Dabb family protein [Nocardia sp. NPDC048505]|uniref:Dabb family protein n=1 Tax=unclassified Nocardia TaxID=2637762 RepID=UPI0033C98EA9
MSVLTHVVLMKFHDPADAAPAARLLADLTASIPQIRSLAVAVDALRTPAAYDLYLSTTHASESELSGYQEHPAHHAVREWLVPRLAHRAVVDYWQG